MNSTEDAIPVSLHLEEVMHVLRLTLIGLMAINLIGCPRRQTSRGSALSETESNEGTLIEKSCRSAFTDPDEVIACVVANKVNLGITVNGRMTAHEEAIEHLDGRILALEAKCNQTPADHSSAPLLK